MEKKFAKGEKEYLVRVSLCDGSYYHGFVFSVDLHTRPKGKRKWVQFIDVNNYRYRQLGYNERDKQREELIISEIPIEWIDEVKQMEIENISKSEYKF